MTEILNTMVTVFTDVTAQTGIDMPLGQFLSDESCRDKVTAIRAAESKDAATALKKQLPCATISALCSKGRKEDDPFVHTGLLCVDIDGQDNPSFPNGEALKSEVSKVSEVAYCALSASGNGCFAILRIDSPEHHAEHFQALKRLFKSRLGIVIDGQCGNIKRLRFASYDEYPYINDAATVFLVFDEAKPSKKREGSNVPLPVPLPYPRHADVETEAEKAGRMVDEIVRRRIDITNSYADWVNIGMALTSLGEEGRSLFHAVSQVCPEYRQDEANRKFTELLRTTKRVGLGSFFYACKVNEIDISNASR